MSDPVVEELLEKGARAGAVALANVANLPEWMQVRALGRDMTPIAQLAVEAAFDAVFPGWREGITREHAIQMSGGGYQVRNPSEAVERVYPLATWIEHQQKYTKVYQRDVVELSAWVPVEEGADR